MIKIYNKDSAKWLKKIPDNSVDSLITDPPAGIGFMGKSWDKSESRDQWIEWLCGIMKECLRVLKPGAHGLVWALPRTSHWTATALEDAGFEVRDIITHIFGKGFPKSYNISKSVDAQIKYGKCSPKNMADFLEESGLSVKADSKKCHEYADERAKTTKIGVFRNEPGTSGKYKGLTEEGEQWNGWGTALKPSSEHWILIRKPLEESTIARQVLATGTGGINIDACRIGCSDKAKFPVGKYCDSNFRPTERTTDNHTNGRFPANVVLSCSCEDGYYSEEKISVTDKIIRKNKKQDSMFRGIGGHGIITKTITIKSQIHQPDCICSELDKQSGTTKQGHWAKTKVTGFGKTKYNGVGKKDSITGGASRFFYCAKISTKERNIGNCKNTHCTVKSMKLMTYLIKLITPPGGTVLDPFLGSGSTMLACKAEGFNGIGIEKEKEYCDIARLRLKGVRKYSIK